MSDAQPTSSSLAVFAGKPIVDKLQREIERLRRSDLSEREAISSISQIIWTDGPGLEIPAPKLREALEAYIEIVSDIARDAERRIPGRSSDSNLHDNELPEDDVPGGERRRPSPRPADQDVRATRRENERRAKRRRNDDGDDDDESDGEKPGKRIFDPTLLNFTSSSTAESGLHPLLVRTNQFKANYRADLNTSVQIILDAVDLPEFPQSMWRDIIQNGFIEYDKLLSASSSITGDPTEIKRVGEVELHTHSLKITRHVTDKLDWTEAFTTWANAVKFAFPFREKEIEDYGSHILKLFRGTGERYHSTVFDYDRAVRTRVARSNSLRYCDFSEFADLDRAHMHPHGTGSESNTNHASQARSRNANKAPRLPAPTTSTELCQRFQIGKEHGNRCLYKHVCDVCSDPGHGRNLCPRRNAGGN